MTVPADKERVELTGVFVISEKGQPPKTKGSFGQFVRSNRDAFRQHFGVDLFEGSLNVLITQSSDLHAQLDAGIPAPAFTIPRSAFVGMAPYLGNGQAWQVELSSPKVNPPVRCWVFRRIKSRVPNNVLEVLSTEGLVAKYGLKDGDPIRLTLIGKGRP